MLVNRFIEISKELGFGFNYGSGAYQNLIDVEDDTEEQFEAKSKYILLLWKDRDLKLNEYGAIIKHEFVGEFVITVKSDDESDYNQKYIEDISKIEDISIQVQGMFACGSVVQQWKETEVANQYDASMDGLKIRFKITYDV